MRGMKKSAIFIIHRTILLPLETISDGIFIKYTQQNAYLNCNYFECLCTLQSSRTYASNVVEVTTTIKQITKLNIKIVICGRIILFLCDIYKKKKTHSPRPSDSESMNPKTIPNFVF